MLIECRYIGQARAVAGSALAPGPAPTARRLPKRNIGRRRVADNWKPATRAVLDGACRGVMGQSERRKARRAGSPGEYHDSGSPLGLSQWSVTGSTTAKLSGKRRGLAHFAERISDSTFLVRQPRSKMCLSPSLRRFPDRLWQATPGHASKRCSPPGLSRWKRRLTGYSGQSGKRKAESRKAEDVSCPLSVECCSQATSASRSLRPSGNFRLPGRSPLSDPRFPLFLSRATPLGLSMDWTLSVPGVSLRFTPG